MCQDLFTAVLVTCSLNALVVHVDLHRARTAASA